MNDLDGTLLVKLLAILSVIMGLIVTIRGLFVRHQTTVGPQPLMVQGATEYATREELARVENEVRALGEKINRLPAELSDQSEHRMERVHTRIDEMRGELTALPDRIIAQLANLGLLNGGKK